MNKYPDEFVERLMARVNKEGRDNPEIGRCWEWTGYCAKSGYGSVNCRRVSKQPMYVHRLSYEIHAGPIENGLHVLHRCDNPCCVNPAHLFLGTQVDNNNDKMAKGRQAKGDNTLARKHPERNNFIRNRGSGLKNEKHPNAKLSDAQVDEIKIKANGPRGTKRKLAAEYGVSAAHISRIALNQSRTQDAENQIQEVPIHSAETGVD